MAIITELTVVFDSAKPRIEILMQRDAIYFEEPIFKLLMSKAVVLVLTIGILTSEQCFPGNQRIKLATEIFGYQNRVIVVYFMTDLVEVSRIARV